MGQNKQRMHEKPWITAGYNIDTDRVSRNMHLTQKVRGLTSNELFTISSALQAWQVFKLSASTWSGIPTHPTSLWQRPPHHPSPLSLTAALN